MAFSPALSMPKDARSEIKTTIRLFYIFIYILLFNFFKCDFTYEAVTVFVIPFQDE
jgi:hypothetical protein